MSDVMNWDLVMQDVVLPILEADSSLIATLEGKHIYAAQSSRPVRIPSIEWMVVDDMIMEVFNSIEVQFDFWARANAPLIERRLRVRLHKNVRVTVNGINLSMLYVDSFTNEYPQPGVVHRSLRFRFEPVRRRVRTES